MRPAILPVTVLTVAALAACATPTTPDARYVGALTPDNPSPLCRPATATLRLRDGIALFTPEETTWSLSGTATADGALVAERTAIGANRQPYPTRLVGKWTTTTATGAYATPRCTYTVALTRG